MRRVGWIGLVLALGIVIGIGCAKKNKGGSTTPSGGNMGTSGGAMGTSGGTMGTGGGGAMPDAGGTP